MKNFKKVGLTIAVVTLLVLATTQIISAAQGTFSDVSTLNKYYDAVEYVYSQDIVEGYEDNTYRPNNEINRAEFTKIIVEATIPDSQISNCDTSKYNFSDTDKDAWYSPYLCTAKKNSLISGYSDGTFRAGNSIIFAEAAKIIAIGYGQDEDADAEPWYEPYVSYLENQSAIPTSIDSLGTEITRGEMAEIIYRISAEITDLESLTYEDLENTTDPSEIDYGYGAGLLPLGDDKYSTSPKIDYVYSCLQEFNGGGAFATGEWINVTKGYWDPDGKVTVDGDIDWPNANISIVKNGDERDFVANGLPIDHTTGVYPIAKTDDAYDYDRNPHAIDEQDYLFSLPTNPEIASSPHCVSMGAIAIATNGVAIFNAFDAEGRDAPAYEIQDHCDGHPQQDGMYHYHNLSSCYDDDSTTGEHSELWGYVLDGFGIYGPKGENGEILTNDDLDECHGHTHEIEWDGQTKEMYHYHATYEFPYTIGCYKGEVDEDLLNAMSESNTGGGNQGGQGGPGGHPH